MALVIQSWGEVQKIPNYEEVAGQLLFKNIFKVEPSAQKIFSFAETYSLGDEALYVDPKFVKHSTSVIEMVTAAVKLLEQDDMDTLTSVLKDLGKRHALYDVLPAHYPIVGEALIMTLAAALGDAFTEDVKKEWLNIADVIFTTMLAGADA
eukprot:CAMPEP_0172441402 /NCGR_PEP_ID=MMETSP1065-20121228/1946_1 /TAXON_ID=265537 /ORGANISM="Amphiprora paludosa, Strain CCMP125" /LENGTH=150 /DNA_ID=CAMNT_0013190753 /DNA_START=182 /DNA_END=634 /DNA_ORIENTATION=+